MQDYMKEQLDAIQNVALSGMRSGQEIGERTAAARINALESALRELLDQIDSLNGVELTKNIEEYKAQACWDDAVRRAQDALGKATA